MNATYFISVWGNTDEEIQVDIPPLYPKIFCMMIGLLAITGVHSNQDHIWLVKIGYYIGFYVDRRS